MQLIYTSIQERHVENRIRRAKTYMKKICPACLMNDLQPNEVANSLSRYRSDYICNDCGMREAFEGFFWEARATAIKSHHND